MKPPTDDRAIRNAPPILLVRMENTYEQGGEMFWVDARVNWANGRVHLTTLGGEVAF